MSRSETLCFIFINLKMKNYFSYNTSAPTVSFGFFFSILFIFSNFFFSVLIMLYCRHTIRFFQFSNTDFFCENTSILFYIQCYIVLLRTMNAHANAIVFFFIIILSLNEIWLKMKRKNYTCML